MNFTTIDHSATLWLNFDGGVVVADAAVGAFGRLFAHLFRRSLPLASALWADFGSIGWWVCCLVGRKVR